MYFYLNNLNKDNNFKILMTHGHYMSFKVFFKANLGNNVSIYPILGESCLSRRLLVLQERCKRKREGKLLWVAHSAVGGAWHALTAHDLGKNLCDTHCILFMRLNLPTVCAWYRRCGVWRNLGEGFASRDAVDLACGAKAVEEPVRGATDLGVWNI
jgi:hypothetical protein